MWLKFLHEKLELLHKSVSHLGKEQRRLEKQLLIVKARQPGTVRWNEAPNGCAGVLKGNHRLPGA